MFTCLPIFSIIISQPHQQIPRHILEDFLMIVREMLLPLAGLPGAESRGATGIDGRFQGSQDLLSRLRKRHVEEKVIDNAVQRREAILDQVLEMDVQHGGLVQPSEIRTEPVGDVQEFDVRIFSSHDAGVKARIEIRQGTVILMMNMPPLHLGHVKDMRDNYVTRIAKDKIRNKRRGTNTLYHIDARKKMGGRNVTRTQRSQPSDRLLRGALASAFALVFGVEGVQASCIRRHLRKTEQYLVKQMRPTLGKRDAE